MGDVFPIVKVHRKKGRKPSKREAAEKQPLIGHCTYTPGKKPNRKNKKNSPILRKFSAEPVKITKEVIEFRREVEKNTRDVENFSR